MHFNCREMLLTPQTYTHTHTHTHTHTNTHTHTHTQTHTQTHTRTHTHTHTHTHTQVSVHCIHRLLLHPESDVKCGNRRASSTSCPCVRAPGCLCADGTHGER